MEQTFSHIEGPDLETMIAFLEHRLSDEETAQLEAFIADKPLYVQALVELEKSLSSDSNTAEKSLKYRNVFEETIWQQGNLTVSKSFPQKRLWQIAAIVLLLVLPIGYWSLKPVGIKSLEQAYLHPYEPLAIRGSTAEQEHTPSALDWYIAEEYEKAIPLFQKQLDEGRKASRLADLVDIHLYMGVSQLFAGHPTEATPFLKAVISYADNPYVYDAKWYLAWALLKMGEKKAALEAFEAIALTSGEYQEAANKLITQLK